MLILDAYNVLHAAPRVDPGLGGLTLPALVRLLEASRYRSGTVVVCDGTGGRHGLDEAYTHQEALIRVIFAGPGKDADAAIERLVIEEERRGRAGQVTVVSSDKGVLASAVGPFGAKARRMTSEQFLRTLLEDARRESERGGMGERTGVEPDRTLDAEGAARWMREFGLDPRRSAPEKPAAAKPSEPQPKVDVDVVQKESTREEWPEGIDPDDLDMKKWLKE